MVAGLARPAPAKDGDGPIGLEVGPEVLSSWPSKSFDDGKEDAAVGLEMTWKAYPFYQQDIDVHVIDVKLLRKGEKRSLSHEHTIQGHTWMMRLVTALRNVSVVLIVSMRQRVSVEKVGSCQEASAVPASVTPRQAIGAPDVRWSSTRYAHRAVNSGPTLRATWRNTGDRSCQVMGGG